MRHNFQGKHIQLCHATQFHISLHFLKSAAQIPTVVSNLYVKCPVVTYKRIYSVDCESAQNLLDIMHTQIGKKIRLSNEISQQITFWEI